MIDLSSKSHCAEYRDVFRKIAVGSEKGLKFRIISDGRWRISKYKGECITETRGKACDFLFLLSVDEVKKAYLVECKGSHVLKAVEQINEFLNYLQIKINSGFNSVHGRIILGQVNRTDIRSTQYKRLMNKLACLGGDLKQSIGLLVEKV